MSGVRAIHESCTGYGFAAGEATGIRTWTVDGIGRLVGAAGHYWTAGVQTAECKARLFPHLTGHRYPPAPFTVDAADADAEPCTCAGCVPRVTADGTHDLHACTCGFYAYHDGIAGYGSSSWAVGVIQGWGRTSVGPRGFRSSKAKIVALALPPLAPGDAALAAATLAGMGIACLAYAAEEARARRWWTAGLAAAAAGMSAAAAAVTARNPGVTPHYQPPHLADKLRARYPDIPIYDSVEAMLAAHPLDKGPAPAPLPAPRPEGGTNDQEVTP